MEQPDEPRARRRALGIAIATALVAVVVAAAVVLFIVLAPGTRREQPARREVPAGRTQPATVPPAKPDTVSAAPPPAPQGEQFGINVNRLFNGRAHSTPQIDAELRAVAATGATVARSDAMWEAIEPRPPASGVHHYDWTFDDLIAGSLAAHDIQWLPLLDYSAPWAESIPGQDHSPPHSPSDFAAFAAALAARYGAGGSFWRTRPDLHAPPATTFEVWNEPDNPSFWKPAPSARRYADLYVATRQAIDAVDPSARVIVGGLSSPLRFLPALLAARPDLAGRVDGVAIHPYGPTPDAVLARVRAARGELSALGLRDVPLYVTEFGWTTRPAGALNYAPASRRPGYIETALGELGHTDCGVAAALLYTWITPGADPANPQDWYGVSPGAGVSAFATGLRRAVAPAASAGDCG
jgi:hypothetical protein